MASDPNESLEPKGAPAILAELDRLVRFEEALVGAPVNERGRDFVDAYLHGARQALLWVTTGKVDAPSSKLVKDLAAIGKIGA